MERFYSQNILDTLHNKYIMYGNHLNIWKDISCAIMQILKLCLGIIHDLLQVWPICKELSFRCTKLLGLRGTLWYKNRHKDASDVYATGCKINGLVFRRHENIKSILVQACKEGHLQVSGETLGYCADSNKRPRDLPIHGYETNLDLLVDVTVVSSLQNVEKAAKFNWI